ncbi:hypothetical protein F5883DRAFT_10330 [Diaporthe sp. PMI_573]|nr:hypothetical protein F5883DRAFT_10330 [Diaporthaceae sp. PMI_573]
MSIRTRRWWCRLQAAGLLLITLMATKLAQPRPCRVEMRLTDRRSSSSHLRLSFRHGLVAFFQLPATDFVKRRLVQEGAAAQHRLSLFRGRMQPPQLLHTNS